MQLLQVKVPLSVYFKSLRFCYIINVSVSYSHLSFMQHCVFFRRRYEQGGRRIRETTRAASRWGDRAWSFCAEIQEAPNHLP